MEHAGLSKEQAMALGKHERDLGAVDPAEPMPQSRAQQEVSSVINVGYLPSDQPMCPHCHTGLHPVRQNPRGDSLFECVQAGCAGDGYMAVYRVSPPAWEAYEGRYGKDAQGWKHPVRYADLQAVLEQKEAQAQAQAQAQPAGKPEGGWPGEVETTVSARKGPGTEPAQESKSVQRRKAAQRAAKGGKA